MFKLIVSPPPPNSVKDNLHEKDTKANHDLDTIERYFGAISDLHDRINALLESIADIYVYDHDLAPLEAQLQRIQSDVAQVVDESKRLIASTQAAYQHDQQLVPTDIGQELTALELLTERLTGAMDEKQREFKRAKTVRSEYLIGVDRVQQFLQQAELRIQDRSVEPLQLKETLNKIQHDLAGVQEQMAGVKQNGQQIIERSRDDAEKDRVRTTIDQLAQQLAQVMAWLDEKKHQVGDSLDAWTRFMNLYQIVMTWSQEKRTFIASPMRITTLMEARQHLQEYGQAVKSIKPIAKNLSEMDKELESITQVTTVGDLRAKLLEAEEAKAEVEATLLERVGAYRGEGSCVQGLLKALDFVSFSFAELAASRDRRRVGAVRAQAEGCALVDRQDDQRVGLGAAQEEAAA